MSDKNSEVTIRYSMEEDPRAPVAPPPPPPPPPPAATEGLGGAGEKGPQGLPPGRRGEDPHLLLHLHLQQGRR